MCLEGMNTGKNQQTNNQSYTTWKSHRTESTHSMTEAFLYVCVPGRCPTVWLCSATAAPSSRGCSSSGRQTEGTPPRTAACGGAQTLSREHSALKTEQMRIRSQTQIKFPRLVFLRDHVIITATAAIASADRFLITSAASVTTIPHAAYSS